MSEPTAPGHAHHNPIPGYLAVFAFLVAVTAFELLPLFGLLDIPAPLLLFLSAVKFTVVVLFFMHLHGDKAINNRLFFVPLFMATGSVGVLMALFGTWSLQWPVRSHHDEVTGVRTEVRDSDEIVARYRGRWTDACNSWVKSAATGNVYCSSPWVGYSNQPAYDALKVVAAPPDPAFDGWDAKSAEDKKAVMMVKGKEVYDSKCAACHQATGLGLAGTFPPLAGDPVANGDVTEHITIILKGLSGKEINGVSYAVPMQAWASLLNDQEVASVVTYERASWGNSGGPAEPAQVAALR
ncbi:MAG: c-type cytochrome [Myxococcales bacterium]|nr:c-type cytochrome [Myxococcales bacterium]